MLRDEYILLTAALIQATKANLIKWSSSCCRSLSYTAQPTPNQIVEIGVYYSIDDNNVSTTCLDFTVFTSEQKVIDEIVLCRGDDTGLFNPLEELYKEAKTQFTIASNPHIPIILKDIAQSLATQLENAESIKTPKNP